MTQPLNGAAQINGLAGLSAHLTDPGDRETYAELISYFHSLPPRDELFRLAELLGFLSLLGQRLPDALAEFLQALRQQTKTAHEYHARVEERLALLPGEIAAGVDPAAIAKAMSETFRQQIAAVGIEESARVLGTSVAAVKNLSCELSSALRSVTDQYAGIGATISAELRKVANASAELRQHNANLIAQAADERWLLKGLLALVLLVIGAVSGIVYEKGSSTALLNDMESELQRIQTPAVPAAASGPRNRK